jgi:hypothetical protein
MSACYRVPEKDFGVGRQSLADNRRERILAQKNYLKT